MGAERSTRRIGGSQFLESQSLAKNGSGSECEPSGVGQLAMIKPKSLLVEIAKQVERLDAHVGAFDAPFQEAPEVFDAVGVYGALSVSLRMVNDFVDEPDASAV